MSQRLPTYGFKWLKDLTVESTKELLSQRLSNTGYTFEVDLEYPKNLWESHNDYPLAPEKLKIYATEKLVGSFYSKSRYVLLYLNLKQYLSLRILKKKKTGINKKVIGKFKDEAAGKQITHFVGLRAKLYSYKIEDQVIKKAKGIKKYCEKRDRI